MMCETFGYETDRCGIHGKATRKIEARVED